MTDSRFELESDIISFLKTHDGPIPPYLLWLDRQAAITRAECASERDEWKAKAEEYRLRISDYECLQVRGKGNCRCFTVSPKTCVRDGKMCQYVQNAVDGE